MEADGAFEPQKTSRQPPVPVPGFPPGFPENFLGMAQLAYVVILLGYS
jgi:hypothetical protein